MEALVYQAYITYLALNGGKIDEGDNGDLKAALETVERLKNDYTRRREKPFLNPSHTREAYIEAFHRKVYERDPFKRKWVSSHKHSEGSDFWDMPDLTEFQFFLQSIFKKGGRILDYCAEYLLKDYSFDGYEEYCICERDDLLYAYFVLRKAIEGPAWENVIVTKTLPPDKSGYDVILASTIDLDINHQKDDLKYSFRSILSDRGILIVESHGDDSDAWFFEPQELEMSISVPDLPKQFKYLYVIRNGKGPDSPAVFVDGQSFFRDHRVSDYRSFFSRELAAMIESRDSNYVIEVLPKDIVEQNYLPGFYLLRQRLHVPGSVFLSDILCHYGEDEMLSVDETNSFFWDGDYLEISDINTDPRLLETRELQRSLDYVNGKWVQVKEKAVLLVRSHRRTIDVGFLADSPHHMLADLLVTIPNSEYDSWFSGFAGFFGVDVTNYDIKYLTYYLRTLPLKPGVDYFSAPWAILGLPIPPLSPEQQRLEVRSYLTQLSNAYLKQVPDVRSQLNAIVLDGAPDSFKTRNKLSLDKLNIKVLEYMKSAEELEGVIKKYANQDIPDSKKPEMILISVDIPKDDLIHAVFSLSNTGLRCYYYSDKGSFNEDTLSFSAFIQKTVMENYFSGKDFLEAIRSRFDEDSYDILDEYPEYMEFFKAAIRFDKEYPDWKLWDYAKRILSKKPLELDISDFRSKIDETIGAFFRVNNVVPKDKSILPDGAIPDLLFRPPYKNRDKNVVISLYEGKYDRKGEEWIRAAYVTIRKLGNIVAHNSQEQSKEKTKQSLGIAAFTLFTEVICWLNRDDVRERYTSGRQLYNVAPLLNERNDEKILDDSVTA